VVSDTAWAASDTLHAAAAALGSRVVRQAADSYARAARVPYARIPRPTPAGNSLRRAARLLSAAAFAGHDPVLAQIALIARLAALAEAVAELREMQQLAAQAAAARHAAGHLHSAAGTRQARPARPRPRTAARLAALGFPSPGPLHPSAPRGPSRNAPARPRPQPRRGPGPPRPRGPTR